MTPTYHPFADRRVSGRPAPNGRHCRGRQLEHRPRSFELSKAGATSPSKPAPASSSSSTTRTRPPGRYLFVNRSTRTASARYPSTPAECRHHSTGGSTSCLTLRIRSVRRFPRTERAPVFTATPLEPRFHLGLPAADYPSSAAAGRLPRTPRRACACSRPRSTSATRPPQPPNVSAAPVRRFHQSTSLPWERRYARSDRRPRRNGPAAQRPDRELHRVDRLQPCVPRRRWSGDRRVVQEQRFRGRRMRPSTRLRRRASPGTSAARSSRPCTASINARRPRTPWWSSSTSAGSS